MKFRSDLSMTYEECCITLLEGLELSAYFCGPSFFFYLAKNGPKWHIFTFLSESLPGPAE